MKRLTNSERRELIEAASAAYFAFHRVRSPYYKRLVIEYAAAMHEITSILEHRKLQSMKAYAKQAHSILTEEADGKA